MTDSKQSPAESVLQNETMDELRPPSAHRELGDSQTKAPREDSNAVQLRFRDRVFRDAEAETLADATQPLPKTIYWNPLLEANAMGRATIEFDLPDAPATFRLRAEAHYNGRIGTAEAKIFTQSPEPSR